MGDTLSCDGVRNFLLNLADRIVQAKDQLNAMDAACGDGDFGTSMYVAFKNVRKTVEESDGDVGDLLTSVGYAVLSSAGGAAGPLFGIFFIESGKAAKDKTEIQLADLAVMFERSMNKIQARGLASVGDKTLIDSLAPAVMSLKDSASAGDAIEVALEKAAEAAEVGSKSTKDLVAKHGKSMYLREQTLGHVDPGAYVMALVFRTLATSYAST